jgi:hypothetical protein
MTKRNKNKNKKDPALGAAAPSVAASASKSLVWLGSLFVRSVSVQVGPPLVQAYFYALTFVDRFVVLS